uniref:Ribosomal RNA small subunit methyltransferase G n=1 Tax=candidate division WOR-3 bacterium TaxID=2052148 RepID=A0A7C3J6R9_UNCW3
MEKDQIFQLKNILKEFEKEEIFEDILNYLNILLKWNRSVNLISKNDEKIIIERHLKDSLVALKIVQKDIYKNIIDIGSGNGFPAIPLSIVLKEKIFTLVEIKEKKFYFLKDVKESLKLKNIILKKDDVKKIDFSPFDLVLSRAFLNEKDIKEFLKKKNYKGDIVYWEKIYQPVILKI